MMKRGLSGRDHLTGFVSGAKLIHIEYTMMSMMHNYKVKTRYLLRHMQYIRQTNFIHCQQKTDTSKLCIMGTTKLSLFYT